MNYEVRVHDYFFFYLIWRGVRSLVLYCTGCIYIEGTLSAFLKVLSANVTADVPGNDNGLYHRNLSAGAKCKAKTELGVCFCCLIRILAIRRYFVFMFEDSQTTRHKLQGRKKIYLWFVPFYTAPAFVVLVLSATRAAHKFSVDTNTTYMFDRVVYFHLMTIICKVVLSSHHLMDAASDLIQKKVFVSIPVLFWTYITYLLLLLPILQTDFQK